MRRNYCLYQGRKRIEITSFNKGRKYRLPIIYNELYGIAWRAYREGNLTALERATLLDVVVRRGLIRSEGADLSMAN